jgi:hypothetical protein
VAIGADGSDSCYCRSLRESCKASAEEAHCRLLTTQTPLVRLGVYRGVATTTGLAPQVWQEKHQEPKECRLNWSSTLYALVVSNEHHRHRVTAANDTAWTLHGERRVSPSPVLPFQLM